MPVCLRPVARDGPANLPQDLVRDFWRAFQKSERLVGGLRKQDLVWKVRLVSKQRHDQWANGLLFSWQEGYAISGPSGVGLFADYIRVTTGTFEVVERFARTLDRILHALEQNPTSPARTRALEVD